jgi:hypothetical protein
MKNLIVIMAVCCCLPVGCAAFSKEAKKESFGRTMDFYETAMRISDLNAVCHFVDESAMSRQDCLKRFGNIKLVSFEIMDAQVDEESLDVRQEIRVGYHFLDHYQIKERQYGQTWHYDEDRKGWLLQNGPPAF